MARTNAEMAKYVAAFKRKDLKAVEAIIRANFAKDYKTIDLKGKTTDLNYMLAQEKEHMAMLKKVEKMSLKISGLKVNGNTAVGKGAFSLDAIVSGDPHKPKETHKLHVESTWDLKMKKVGNKWWAAEDKTTSEKVLIDGKPMPGM